MDYGLYLRQLRRPSVFFPWLHFFALSTVTHCRILRLALTKQKFFYNDWGIEDRFNTRLLEVVSNVCNYPVLVGFFDTIWMLLLLFSLAELAKHCYLNSVNCTAWPDGMISLAFWDYHRRLYKVRQVYSYNTWHGVRIRRQHLFTLLLQFA